MSASIDLRQREAVYRSVDATTFTIIRDTAMHGVRARPALQPHGTHKQDDQDNDRPVRGPKPPAISMRYSMPTTPSDTRQPDTHWRI